MSITVFYALCILSIDFMIYFFCKLTYGEKRRAKPRRLSSEYYDRGPRTNCTTNPSSPHLISSRKTHSSAANRVLTMPERRHRAITTNH